MCTSDHDVVIIWYNHSLCACTYPCTVVIEFVRQTIPRSARLWFVLLNQGKKYWYVSMYACMRKQHIWWNTDPSIAYTWFNTFSMDWCYMIQHKSIEWLYTIQHQFIDWSSHRLVWLFLLMCQTMHSPIHNNTFIQYESIDWLAHWCLSMDDQLCFSLSITPYRTPVLCNLRSWWIVMRWRCPVMRLRAYIFIFMSIMRRKACCILDFEGYACLYLSIFFVFVHCPAHWAITHSTPGFGYVASIWW